MDEQLQQVLYQRYPLIFSNALDPNSQSPMRFGIACGDGWFSLLWGLCYDLERLAERDGTPVSAVRQVKQKFGRLRFYCAGSQSMQMRIRAAEEQSGSICDRCGGPGEPRQVNGWFVTRCALHVPTTDTPEGTP